MQPTCGSRLRYQLAAESITPFIGVYDVFSARVAARHFDALFVSGFGFAASHYGLPDLGYIAWSDMLAFVERLRAVLPDHHLLVDIDDGYGDPAVAAHVVKRLEDAGASGVVLEDQARPRRCGHLDGKQLLPLDVYLAKLERVLAVREDMYVIARTDATEPDEILRRARAFSGAGADAVLADGLRSLSDLRALSRGVACPITFNQIAGGKSPPTSLTELQGLGVSLVIYSTPCLFAAQEAIEQAMGELRTSDGRLPAASPRRVGVPQCTRLLRESHDRQRSVPASLI